MTRNSDAQRANLDRVQIIKGCLRQPCWQRPLSVMALVWVLP